MKYVIFDDRFIITANDDGTIPLNSKVVCELPKGGFQQDLLTTMVAQANKTAITTKETIINIHRLAIKDLYEAANTARIRLANLYNNMNVSNFTDRYGDVKATKEVLDNLTKVMDSVVTRVEL